MREISPALNLSADEYLATVSPPTRQFVALIREQKKDGTRRQPSTTLIDRSKILTAHKRLTLLDHVAALVDENIYGRAEMCQQFADLLQRSLAYLKIPARTVIGTAIYYVGNREVFRWRHAWVRVSHEVIDGNVNSLIENPVIPSSVCLAPYWGPIEETPQDRKLIQNKTITHPDNDVDVTNIWWPELQEWLDQSEVINGV